MQKKKVIIISFITVFVLFLAVSLSVGGFMYYKLSTIKRIALPKSNEELGIRPHVVARETFYIRNIALFGIDVGRNKFDPPHSDSITIATLDTKHNKIKFTSILRDTYVEIEGYKKSKITEAFTYGGPALAVKTLNQNFNLDIKDFIVVNFFGLEKIIDAIGGVDVSIKSYEIKEVNKWVKELSELQHKKPTYITNSGMQRLNGIQAVAYSRIRKVGDGDFERSSRQRTVLTEMMNKIKDAGIIKYPYLISEISSFVETSISNNDIIDTGRLILTSDFNTIEQQRFPLDGYCKGERINRIWYLVPKPDIETTAKQIYDFIFDDIKPIPTDPLF